MSVFLSGPGQIGFYAAIALYLLLAAIFVATSRRRAPLPKAELTESRKASSRLNSLVVIFGLLIIPSFGYAGIAPLPDWTYYLGLPLFLVGVAILTWAGQTLGRNYSPHALIYQGHQLVERGPYRFVQHPIYTGSLLVVVGWGMMAQSWAAVVLTGIAAAIAIAYRVRVEEKLLVAEFGEQYKSYSRRVKRLIPFVF